MAKAVGNEAGGRAERRIQVATEERTPVVI